MSIDADFLKPCTHVNGKYIISNCPVCHSLGFYFDIVIDQTRSPVKLSGELKTIQGLAHLLLTDEGTYLAYDYPEYGTKLSRFIGTKNIDENRARFQVLRDLKYYMDVKIRQNFLFANIDSSEVLKQILSISTLNTEDEQRVDVTAIIGDNTRPQYFKLSRITR